MFVAIRTVNYPSRANRFSSYLRAHSGERARDPVTSLVLSLSPQLDAAGDRILETGVNAAFGQG